MKAIAVVAGIAVAVVLLAVVLGPIIWLIIPIILTVGVTAALRRGPVTSGFVAAALGFTIVVAYAALVYYIRGPEDRASDPNCDGFCFSKTTGWVLILLIASFLGAIVAVASAVLAAFVSARSGRVDASP